MVLVNLTNVHALISGTLQDKNIDKVLFSS